MRFDDGEVLQGLDEGWAFMGANAMEWGCGLMVFIMISLFADSPARAMPFMLLGGVLTATSLATMRKSYPDQERGVKNALCVAFGFPPPGIPEPSALQSIWSACPLRGLSPKCKFVMFGFGRMFPSFERQFKENG